MEVTELAARVGATPATIRALEQGAIGALPPWPETARIVSRWITLAGLDPRPALVELDLALRAPSRAVHPARQSTAPRSAFSSPYAADELDEPGESDTGERIAAVARVLANRQGGSYAVPALSSDTATLDGERRSALTALRSQPSAIFRRIGASLRAVTQVRPSGATGWRVGAVLLVMLTLWGTAVNTTVVAAAVSVLPAPAGRVVRSLSDTVAEWLAPVREGHRWIEVADPRSRRADKLRPTPRSD